MSTPGRRGDRPLAIAGAYADAVLTGVGMGLAVASGVLALASLRAQLLP